MADEYSHWRAELGSTEPVDHHNVDTEMSGFWRMDGARTKPSWPVAIWKEAGKDATIFQIGRKQPMNSTEHATEWAEFIGNGWLWCRAVTKVDWSAALATGFWPGDNKPSRQVTEEERLGIDVSTGGNNPPLDESLADQIKALADILEATPEPPNQDSANKLSGNLDKMRGLLKLAEAQRIAEKEPWLIGEREVDAKWKAVKAPGEDAGVKAEARRKAFLKKEQDRLDAEAAAERKRLQAIADAENARIREENKKLREEAEARRQADIAALPPGIMASAPEPEPELIPEVAAPVVETARAVAGAAYGRASGLKKVKVVAVENPEKLAMHFITTNDGDFADYLSNRAKAALRGKVVLPGCTSKEELQ